MNGKVRANQPKGSPISPSAFNSTAAAKLTKPALQSWKFDRSHGGERRSVTVNRLPLRRDQWAEGPMDDIVQWIVAACGIGVLAFGLTGFFSGLSLPPNSPEHRSHGKGDNWLT